MRIVYRCNQCDKEEIRDYPAIEYSPILIIVPWHKIDERIVHGMKMSVACRGILIREDHYEEDDLSSRSV